MLVYLSYVVIGAISGILGGLLGIGGGVVTVPCFLYLFNLLDYPQSELMHVVVATSLSSMIFNTIAMTWAHNRHKNVLWNVFMKMVPGLILGSAFGALLSIWLSGRWLEIFFGVFLCVFAFRFYFQKPIEHNTFQLPSTSILSILSGCIGSVSSLLGIGGGSMTVPLLSALKITSKKAIGTSAAVTLLTTCTGTLFYAIAGQESTEHLNLLRLINLPAFLIVGLTAFFVAPIGVILNHKFPPSKVRKFFAVILLLTGISLIDRIHWHDQEAIIFTQIHQFKP